MNNISDIEKAKILYNHLVFNNVQKEYFDDIKKDKRYKNLSKNKSNVIFGGRLAEYKYYDMHQVFGSALAKMKNIPNK